MMSLTSGFIEPGVVSRRAATFSIPIQYVALSRVYTDWRRWALSVEGGKWLCETIKKVTGRDAALKWYPGTKGNPYAGDDEPSEGQVAFDGEIKGTVVIFEVAEEMGHIELCYQPGLIPSRISWKECADLALHLGNESHKVSLNSPVEKGKENTVNG